MTQRGIAVVARAASGALVAIGLCTLLTGSALAASAPRTTAVKHAARRHPARAHRAPGAAGLGMRAVVDPATGRIVPGTRVTDAPGSAAPAPVAGPASASAGTQGATPQVRRLADGSEIVAVPADQQEYEVVRVGKDGKLLRACVHGDPKAATFHAREDK